VSDVKDDDGAVGYGRPPKHSRFKSGQSGNPRGRPKGARNFSNDLADELAERIRIREGGRERSVSKRRAMLKALVAKGLKGDARAASLVFALVAKHLEGPDSTVPDQPLAAEDMALLDAFVERRGEPKKPSTAPKPTPEEDSDVD
jgi:hypothetical protein